MSVQRIEIETLHTISDIKGLAQLGLFVVDRVSDVGRGPAWVVVRRPRIRQDPYRAAERIILSTDVPIGLRVVCNVMRCGSLSARRRCGASLVFINKIMRNHATGRVRRKCAISGATRVSRL
ncbi:hypothetical protein EVAR_11957_1 [Eumeta japonica]|uniref:Uncharacterized protein n=1 Tax=Eumeta variegata TaxID=151549 RepID=A0A4C1U521_EUMVA|nr:hypothetical protein EVAR_11957_1 [Eumeta japonica]